MAENRQVFGVTGDWSTAALGPGVWYSTVCEGGFRIMAARVRKEENSSENQQRKREAEGANKVEATPGVTIASFRRFGAALIGSTQGLSK